MDLSSSFPRIGTRNFNSDFIYQVLFEFQNVMLLLLLLLFVVVVVVSELD